MKDSEYYLEEYQSDENIKIRKLNEKNTSEVKAYDPDIDIDPYFKERMDQYDRCPRYVRDYMKEYNG